MIVNEPNDIRIYWKALLQANKELLRKMQMSGKATDAEIEKQKNIVKHLEGLVNESHER